jgi:hypothetical protein
MAAVWILCAYKWGDWKNWRRYYPTMLFFGMGDLIYKLVFQGKILWKFESNLIVEPINELFVIFTIFFSTALLFLSNFPKKLSRQIIRILIYIVVYMCIEIFTTLMGMEKSYNGWNLWWSLLFNCVMFPLLILHHKNPLWAWIGAFIFLSAVMMIFNVPLAANV